MWDALIINSSEQPSPGVILEREREGGREGESEMVKPTREVLSGPFHTPTPLSINHTHSKWLCVRKQKTSCTPLN